jgi:hypothetical protein
MLNMLNVYVVRVLKNFPFCLLSMSGQRGFVLIETLMLEEDEHGGNNAQEWQ